MRLRLITTTRLRLMFAGGIIVSSIESLGTSSRSFATMTPSHDVAIVLYTENCSPSTLSRIARSLCGGAGESAENIISRYFGASTPPMIVVLCPRRRTASP